MEEKSSWNGRGTTTYAPAPLPVTTLFALQINMPQGAQGNWAEPLGFARCGLRLGQFARPSVYPSGRPAVCFCLFHWPLRYIVINAICAMNYYCGVCQNGCANAGNTNGNTAQCKRSRILLSLLATAAGEKAWPAFVSFQFYSSKQQLQFQLYWPLRKTYQIFSTHNKFVLFTFNSFDYYLWYWSK